MSLLLVRRMQEFMRGSETSPRDNITFFDHMDSNQPEQQLFNRFERFDIEGDEDMNANFTYHEHSQIHTMLIPSPPPEISQPAPMGTDVMRDEHPDQSPELHTINRLLNVEMAFKRTG